MLRLEGKWIEAFLCRSRVSINAIYALARPGREVAAAALNVRVVLGLHIFVFSLLIDAFLGQLVPLLGNRGMLFPSLLIALDLHEHPTHVFLVRELDKDLPGLQVLIGVLVGELWRHVQRMIPVVSRTLLRIFVFVA